MYKLKFIISLLLLTVGLYSADMKIKTLKVENLDPTSKSKIKLNDYISVQVSNLDSLLKIIPPEESLVLFMDDVPLKGVYPESVDTLNNKIIFHVTRDSVSLRSWNIIYKYPRQYERKVKISVGSANHFVIPTDVRNFVFVVVRKTPLIIAWIGLIILLIIFYFLAIKSNIIKDQCEKKPNPYSLARAQLAFWTFLIVYSFLFIWVVTGDLPMITGTTLTLLSISIVTTAGARVIDQSHQQTGASAIKPSRGFFLDILSDETGVNIHRFQLVVWTLLIGIFFVRYVILNLSMPQLDENLMILMGISNGTYLGLKIPENKDKAAKQTAEETVNVEGKNI